MEFSTQKNNEGKRTFSIHLSEDEAFSLFHFLRNANAIKDSRILQAFNERVIVGDLIAHLRRWFL